ncbi:MAG: hypothetical protein ABIR84_03570 [Candidatus Nitrotoga sp.]
MLRKFRQTIGHRDRLNRLENMIEINDILVCWRHSKGERGHGAVGKTPILLAVTNRGKAVYVAMEAVV